MQNHFKYKNALNYILSQLLLIVNLENFSDEDYDDYNYQYAMDDVDPAAKYTEHNDDDEAEG